MSLSVQQIIDIISPQYSSDSDLTNTITLSTIRTSEDAFGDKYNYAIALRVAHILTLRDMNKDGVSSVLGGASGSISNKREGDLSVSFSGMATASLKSSTDLSLTRYGIELQGLIDGNIVKIGLSNYSNVRNSLLGVTDE